MNCSSMRDQCIAACFNDASCQQIASLAGMNPDQMLVGCLGVC